MEVITSSQTCILSQRCTLCPSFPYWDTFPPVNKYINCLLFLKKVSGMDGSFPPLAFTLQYSAYSVPKFSISSLLLQARQFRHGSSEVICSSDQHRYPQVQNLWLPLRIDGQKWCLCEWSELYSDFFFLFMSLMPQHQVDHGRQHLNSREKTVSFIQYLKYDSRNPTGKDSSLVLMI